MSSTRLPPIIDLALGHSPRLAAIIGSSHLLAVVAVFLTGLPWWTQTLLGALLVLNAWWMIRTRALALGAAGIVRFVWEADGSCEWQTRDGRFHQGKLAPGVLVISAVVIMRLHGERWRRRTLCVCPDAVDAEAFRRLRVRLMVAPPLAPRFGLKRLLEYVHQQLREKGWSTIFASKESAGK